MPFKSYRRNLLTLIVLLLAASSSNARSRTSDFKLLVPAYGNPCCGGGLAMWPQLTDTAASLGPDLVVILNPNSGPGGGEIDPNYIGVNGQGPFVDYRNAGGVAIGYVLTDWAERPSADVKGDIDRYFDPTYWRGAGIQVDGIFFDEMSNDLADVGYYEDLRDYVRGKAVGAMVVGNPGTTFVDNPSGQDQWTITDYGESADTLVVFEQPSNAFFTNYTPPPWLNDFPADRFGHIVYGLDEDQLLSAISLAVKRKAGWIYLTDDDLPNPYDQLPTYWSELVEAGSSLVFAAGFESGDLSPWAQ